MYSYLQIDCLVTIYVECTMYIQYLFKWLGFVDQVLSKEAVWQGKDKQDRPCLIVTARLHKCSRTVGSGQSFQKVGSL
jgi:hypothetical protein